MSDKIVVVTSVLLLVILAFLALNSDKITGNAVSEACMPYSRTAMQVFNSNENIKGKISIAAGDIDLNGYNDIVVGTGDVGGSKVRVFSIFAEKLLEFKAFNDNENPNGDVYVAVGDVDEDRLNDIAVGSGLFSDSLIRVFDHDGDEFMEISAFNSIENPNGKVSVAVADLDLDGKNEIIAGTGKAGKSRVKIFDNKGNLLNQFNAFSSQNSGGDVYVAAGDVVLDEKKEIIAGTGKAGTSRIAIFTDKGKKIKEFSAIKSRNGDVYVAAGDVVLGDKEEIIAGSGSNGNNAVVYDSNGRVLYSISPFNQGINPDGEVFVASANLIGNKKNEIISATGLSGSSYIDITEIKCSIDLTCQDDDNDGSCYKHDCLDINRYIYPGAIELCDKLDNDCNDIIDEHCNQCIPFNEICSDNVDNDCDGKIDCGDDNCVGFERCF